MENKESIEATCPECRGPLTVYREGGLVEIRCLVKHTYSPITLLEAHCEAEESALWAAVVALKESAAIIDSLSTQFPPGTVERLRIQLEKKQNQAAVIEGLIAELETFDVDSGS